MPGSAEPGLILRLRAGQRKGSPLLGSCRTVTYTRAQGGKVLSISGVEENLPVALETRASSFRRVFQEARQGDAPPHPMPAPHLCSEGASLFPGRGCVRAPLQRWSPWPGPPPRWGPRSRGDSPPRLRSLGRKRGGESPSRLRGPCRCCSRGPCRELLAQLGALCPAPPYQCR